ncbi:nucleotidyltransferase [Clostridia bacterium]|nr:nucleotidyltransferase [Clostridia bacterium]
MKAVILAGGEGTRLRPLSLHKPKPMVPIFDRPVLEYTINHLKSHGITDLIATLRALPHVVTDFFGDGTRWGVHIEHKIEREPLGTAGAVRAVLPSLDPDSPTLIMSGDGMCDFDLSAAINFHMSRNAAATLILRRQTNLMGYGLVMTDRSGRVTRFIEKPSWGQVFADTVNTGIYILGYDIIERIPQGKTYDFARDLFPLLLAEGAAIYGYAADGYWCDIGDTEAYRQCVFDMLDGKLKYEPNGLRVGRGVWSDSVIPTGTYITPPCYIAADVRIGAGARIGPYAVLGAGCSLGDGAVVERSILDGAAVGGHADVSGAIVCRGVTIGEGARLHEGCVLGEGVSVGAHAVVTEESRIWPGKEIEDGARVSGSLAGSAARRVLFDGAGCLSGQINVDLTPDVVLRLGAACAAVARDMDAREVALSWQGGDAARVMSLALETGVTAAGCGVVRAGAAFPAAAAFAGGLYRFALSVFVRQRGGVVTLYFFGADGLPLERAAELKLEAVATRGEVTYREARAVGSARDLSGVAGLYELAAAAAPAWFEHNKTSAVSARSGGASGQALYNVLKSTGCAIRPETRLPLFEVSADGFTVTAADEQDRNISHERLMSILSVFEASTGNNILAAPYAAPMQMDKIAHILRVGRDAGARELLAKQPFMRDGIFMTARLTYAMMTSGKTLSEMNDSLPPFYLTSVELPLTHDRGAVMRSLAEGCGDGERELYEGLRAKSKANGGWVHVAPLPGRRALRITGEGASEEIAAELCKTFRRRAIEADRYLTD